MQSGGRQRNAGAAGRAAGPVVAIVALCLVTAGCTAALPPILNPLAPSHDITIAVESIDGPPREVSQRLISDLNAEGVPLRIAVVAAPAEATYRMRGYLATHAGGPTTAVTATTVTWAWDLYDAGLNRAVRLTGEEQVAGGAAAKSWAIADEALLRRIAHTGMDQLAAFMTTPPIPPAPSPIPAAPVPDTVAQEDHGSEPTAFAGMPRLADATGRR
jgi:hypothetical protein